MYELIIENTYESAKERDAHMKEVKKSNVEALTQTEEGNIRYEYLISTKNDHTVILLEQWESAKAQEIHTHGSNIQTVISLKNKYVKSQTMQIYDCREL